MIESCHTYRLKAAIFSLSAEIEFFHFLYNFAKVEKSLYPMDSAIYPSNNRFPVWKMQVLQKRLQSSSSFDFVKELRHYIRGVVKLKEFRSNERA